MKAETFDRRAVPKGAAFSTWTAPDGWTYRRMDWPQGAGAGTRGSLLFAGGRGDFIEKYLEAHHHWHRRGWNVTTFDWRGQGGSRGSIVGGHFESMDPLVDDFSALVEAWRGATKGPHAVVAHSMGGHVLLRTLAERRPRIAAAVAVAPMVAINTSPLPEWSAASLATAMTLAGCSRLPAWRQPEAPAPPGSSRQNFLTACPDRYADELWWWKREPGFNLGVPTWGWLAAAYRSSAALTPERLRGIRVPLLFVATERDRLVSAAAIRRAASTVPGAELLMFEDAGHEILREADEVRLDALARIDSFLDDHART
jgi:lysophospholipase